MFYRPDIDPRSHGLPFNPLKALVVPRPIAWISSRSPEGQDNLAPFSYFQMLIDSPPTLMFSVVGPHADGDVKDTAYNIQRTGEFVYNMATYDQRDAVNRTSSAVGRDVDEFQLAGLTKLESEQVAPCRVAESPVHMECKLLQVIQLPYRNPAVQVRIVLGEVVGIHIDDALIDAEGKVDITRAKPLARLGYKDYASIDAVFELARPK